MSEPRLSSPSRREFLILGGASAAAVALVGLTTSAAGAAGPGVCGAGGCTETTVWMLDPDWGYARGPHDKTRLVSRASRAAAANRVARSEQDALDMNLHVCSWAPAVGVTVCAARADAVFSGYAADWDNPWNSATVSLVDLRHVSPELDLFSCPSAPPPGVVTSPTDVSASPSAIGTEAAVATPGAPGAPESSPLAFTGTTDRRLLFVGAGAVVAGALLHLGGKRVSPASDTSDIPEG